MEAGLGRFGDRRLQKGGRSFWAGSLPLAAESCGCVDWAALGQERFV